MRTFLWALPLMLPGVALAQAASPQPGPPPRPARSAAPAVPHITTAAINQMKYPPLRPVQIPHVEVSTLPNGMKLYLLEDHELPVISGNALVRTGNLFDPADKIGLADMTGTLLRTGGTRTKTADQLDEELENIAASVESSIGESNASVRFSALKENGDEVLAIFKDVLLNPEFRQDKIDLEKTQLRSGISRRNDEASGILQREFPNIVYGRNTPYGWQMEYATVDRITRQDLIGFYKRYYFPGNIMLSIRGDFATAEMKDKIQKLFAGWTSQQPPVPPFPKVERKAAPGIFTADKEDVTQTFFSIGQLGGELREKDYPALEVMADILGGGFQSRLFRKVRTELGYVYNISANWAADYDHPGVFEISGSTKGASTVDTIQAIHAEIERIRGSEVTDAELKVAKDSALNGFVFAFDTRAKTLGRLLTYEYFGYPKDFIDQYQKALAGVTKADVLRVAKEHLQPADLTVVAVGRAEDVKKLATVGSVTPIDLKIPEPSQEAAPTNAATRERGKELLAKAQQAVGGADKLAGIKDMIMTAEYQAEATAGGMKAKQTVKWLAPANLRQEMQLPFGMVIATYDGKSGWVTQGTNRQPLAGPALKQMQGEILRFYPALLLSDRDPDRSVNAQGESAIEISDKAGNKVVLHLGENGLPEKLTYQMPPIQGPPQTVENSLGEMRDVNGIKMPFRIEISQGGKKAAVIAVQEYKVNQDLKLEDITKRQ